jgi:hypothetical protein
MIRENSDGHIGGECHIWWGRIEVVGEDIDGVGTSFLDGDAVEVESIKALNRCIAVADFC